MYEGLTVRQLEKLCGEQIALGNGDKHILISDDDEGNGYHTLFYAFTSDPDMIEELLQYEHDNHEKDDVVVLG